MVIILKIKDYPDYVMNKCDYDFFIEIKSCFLVEKYTNFLIENNLCLNLENLKKIEHIQDQITTLFFKHFKYIELYLRERLILFGKYKSFDFLKRQSLPTLLNIAEKEIIELKNEINSVALLNFRRKVINYNYINLAEIDIILNDFIKLLPKYYHHDFFEELDSIYQLYQNIK